MKQMKFTPIRLNQNIYVWAGVLMILFVLQIINAIFHFCENDAKNVLDFYTFIIVVVSMLSVWLLPWHIDAKEPKGVAHSFLIWLNFLMFSIFAILLFVNSQQVGTIMSIVIMVVASVGNIGALIYTLMGKFNRNIDVEDNTKNFPLRINSSVYYWVVTMLIAFYLIVFHKVFDLLPESVFNYISFGGFVMSFWLIADLLRNKYRIKCQVDENDNKAVSGTILLWVFALCATLIWNRLVIDVIEPFGLLHKMSLSISVVINTIFVVLLLSGKFKIKD